MFWEKNISKLSDEEIMQKYLISSNAEYIGELYQRYVPLLYGIGLKYLQSADKAQNAVMQLFENITTKTALNEVKEFRTWICTMMKNQCMQVKPVNSKINTLKQNEICSIFEKEQTDEKNRLLQIHIKKLPVEQRIPIIRFFTDEMSYMDIAEGTGRNLNQVKNLIEEGMQNLKGYMEDKAHE
ncbi:DNA-directed RNA polymerase sigma-70 factor [Bacteroidia bacterium]|nr:DNA-directed RNA polymerase sigma-70 factor [Bacteroidia bacterium]